ncbi:Desulfoferrodoxin [Sporomusa silvacetica DSM 10669]|uniref:Desulfoferrodoxin n=1 Tax=Sporomusa silvacetica DSM 10669 TaxID=1123289 RepID=A0ABZ3IL27_9FIRM|nr:desulfoferrodoxin [Sporomusa silvacetica]OZC13581.1 desulfoferrodoxin [Sporomusa silvacetica DSM 10669]
MKEKIILFRCSVCGNIVELIKSGGGQLVCCGKPMEKLEANTTDAAAEKHVPVAERRDGKLYVKVGSVEHPMTEAHYIEWIAVTDGIGTQRIFLSSSDKPEAIFCDKENVEIYAYCNLHGLWKTAIS